MRSASLLQLRSNENCDFESEYLYEVHARTSEAEAPS